MVGIGKGNGIDDRQQRKYPCVNLCAIFSSQVCMHRTLCDIKIAALHMHTDEE